VDLTKVQKSMTREAINGFLVAVGMDPNEIVEVHINPHRVIVTRYIFGDDGNVLLDHLGPRTVESHFNIH
jgi:hypothetical protein